MSDVVFSMCRQQGTVALSELVGLGGACILSAGAVGLVCAALGAEARARAYPGPGREARVRRVHLSAVGALWG